VSGPANQAPGEARAGGSRGVPPPLDPGEWELLLLAVRPDLPPLLEGRLRAHLEAGPRWDRLLAWGERLGALPLLHHRLAALTAPVPPEALAALARAYTATSLRSLRLFGLLGRILARAEAEGLDVLCLKGAALAQELYGDAGLRPMGDLDLLVRREDVGPVERLLEGLGGYLSPDGQRREGAVRQTVLAEVGHGLAWWFPPICRVELHQQVLAGPGAEAGQVQERIWAASRVREGRRVLGPEDQVLHLAEHLDHHLEEGAIYLYWIVDLWALLARLGPGLDRRVLAERARELDLEPACRRAFAFVGAGWDGAPDTDPLDTTRNMAAVLAEGASGEGHLPGLYALGSFRKVKGLRSRLRLAREILAPDPWKLEGVFGRRDPRLRPLLLLAWPWAKAWSLAKALVRRWAPGQSTRP